MGKESKQPQGDILDEKYKGANAAIAAAGEAYYAHYWMAFVGLAGGMLGALLFHNNVGRQITKLREAAVSWVESKNILPRLSGKTIHGVFGTGQGYLKEEFDATTRAIEEVAGNNDLSPLTKKIKTAFLENGIEQIKTKERGFGYWLLSHTLYKIPGVRSKLSEVDGIDTAVAAGGLLGAFGFFVAPWVYATKGVHNAHQGKDQFKRAQQEIRELREDREFLEQKNADLRSELRTTKEARVNVSGDEVHTTADTPEAPAVLAKRKDDAMHGEPHPHHAHHSEKHQQHAGKSHGDQVRGREATATEHALGA